MRNTYVPIIDAVLAQNLYSTLSYMMNVFLQFSNSSSDIFTEYCNQVAFVVDFKVKQVDIGDKNIFYFRQICNSFFILQVHPLEEVYENLFCCRNHCGAGLTCQADLTSSCLQRLKEQWHVPVLLQLRKGIIAKYFCRCHMNNNKETGHLM